MFKVMGLIGSQYAVLSQHTNLIDAQIQLAAYQDFHGEPGTEIATDYKIVEPDNA